MNRILSLLKIAFQLPLIALALAPLAPTVLLMHLSKRLHEWSCDDKHHAGIAARGRDAGSIRNRRIRRQPRQCRAVAE